MARPEKPQPIIRVLDVTAGYPDFTVLKHISFEVYPGEIFGILGGSGCGKTTLMRHMIGLIPPLAGRILIDGEDIAQAQDRQRIEILRGVGVMYQQGALFGSMTLLENVRLPIEEHTALPPRARDLVATMKLRLVGLGGFENHLPAEISGGMRKRAAIARAMALDPRIIFLDEPAAGLDPVTSADLDKLILQLSRSLGITFVMVTHELHSIFATNDRVIMLDTHSKSIIATGAPRDLADSDTPAVRRFFARDAEDETEPTVPIPRPVIGGRATDTRLTDAPATREMESET